MSSSPFGRVSQSTSCSSSCLSAPWCFSLSLSALLSLSAIFYTFLSTLSLWCRHLGGGATGAGWNQLCPAWGRPGPTSQRPCSPLADKILLLEHCTVLFRLYFYIIYNSSVCFWTVLHISQGKQLNSKTVKSAKHFGKLLLSLLEADCCLHA